MKPINKQALDKLALAYSALEHSSPQAPRLMEEALAALPEDFCALTTYSSRTGGGLSVGYLARAAIDTLTSTGHFAHPNRYTRQEAALNLWGQVFSLALQNVQEEVAA